MKNRFLLGAFLVCIFVALASAGFLLWPAPKTTKIITPPSLESLASTNTQNIDFDNNNINPTDYTVPEVTENKNSSTIINANTSTTSTLNNDKNTTDTSTLKAQMLVGNKKYVLKFKTGDTLINAMDKLMLASDQPFLYMGKKYADMGIMVQEINGIKNDIQNNKYWIYYINGASAKIGVSNYQLKANDLIEWKFTTSTM